MQKFTLQYGRKDFENIFFKGSLFNLFFSRERVVSLSLAFASCALSWYLYHRSVQEDTFYFAIIYCTLFSIFFLWTAISDTYQFYLWYSSAKRLSKMNDIHGKTELELTTDSFRFRSEDSESIHKFDTLNEFSVHDTYFQLKFGESSYYLPKKSFVHNDPLAFAEFVEKIIGNPETNKREGT